MYLPLDESPPILGYSSKKGNLSLWGSLSGKKLTTNNSLIFISTTPTTDSLIPYFSPVT